MSVEFTIDLRSDMEKQIAKQGKKLKKAYDLEMMEELSMSSIRSYQLGDDLQTMNYKLNKILDSHEVATKTALKEEIARKGGVVWEEIATTPSLNGTYNQTVDRSWRNARKMIKNKVMKERVTYKRLSKYYSEDKVKRLAQMGIKGKTEAELKANIAKHVAESMGKALSKTMHGKETALVRTEVRGIKYKKFEKEAQKTMQPVIWITHPTEFTCPDCSALNGQTWPNINLAPSYPLHPRCNCEILFVK